MFLVRFWGVRGSIPVPGPATVQYGGNTACVEVRAGSEIIVFDAGTGIRALGAALAAEQPLTVRLFLSHYHWDHLQGFAFFQPAFTQGNRLDLFGPRRRGRTLEEALARQMGYPTFPVRMEDMAAELAFHDLAAGQAVVCGDAVVSNARLNHPGGAFAYRVDFAGHAVVYASDTEHFAVPDHRLVDLAEGCDLLIYDTTFTPAEYAGQGEAPPRTGWGHSTWEAGVELARAAHARQLVLFHYSPDHDDAAIRAMAAEARAAFPGVVAAREGMALQLD